MSAAEVRQALALGDALLQLVQAPPGDAALEEIFALLDNREQVLAGAVRESDAGLLEQLVDQQRALELQFAHWLEQGRKAMRGSQAAQQTLAGTRSLLNLNGRSRSFDVRR